MVDADRLRRVLQRVADDVATLRAYAQADPASLQRPQLGDIKYTFITAIEGCIDAAQHVCSSEGFGPPETNAEAVLTLARHRILDADLADAIAQAIGFRNRLVHGYAAIDDNLVRSYLKRTGDLDAFVAALSDLIR